VTNSWFCDYFSYYETVGSSTV